MTTIIEQESAEEKLYRDVCTRLSLLNVQIEEAQRVFDAARARNPKLELTQMGLVQRPNSERDAAEARLNELLLKRQPLFVEHAELKFKIGLGR